MKDILVVATDTMTVRPLVECRSFTVMLRRWTVSTIEPVNMRATRLATRPELRHDYGTLA
jgi:hypothetical protein